MRTNVMKVAMECLRLPRSRLIISTIILFQTSGLVAADTTSQVEHPQCRLFLAESTIPNAGLGIFTGIDLEAGDAVAEPDIVVPLADFEWHSLPDMDFDFLWYDYSWQAGEVGMDFDVVDGTALVIGTGCMPNCNFALINAHEGQPDYDHAGLHRNRDVGVGGFTGYYNQKMIAERHIPTGGEIFVTYGEHWFITREDTMAHVPFEGSYKRVDMFLKKIQRLFAKYETDTDPDFMKDFWEVITSVSYESKFSNALPLSFEDMKSALSIGSAETRLPYSVRSLEWLNEHGRCMDNIRPGNSTIKQAGRGAFASRFIPKGGIVAPGPLLHLQNRTSIYMYEMNPENGERDTSQFIGMQLIVNYCFGHSESSLLLCPYTSPSAYINHNSHSPNARIFWANDDTHNHNPDWLDEDVEFLKKKNYIGLSVNFIALRDIQPGEEVFIDYGPEWEAAWNKHVDEWKPPQGSENYMPAAEIAKDTSAPLRTVHEQKHMPYPENILFYCHYGYMPGLEGGEWEWDDTFIQENRYPCKITRRKIFPNEIGQEGYLYDAMMLTQDEMDHETGVFVGYIIPSGEKHVLKNIPRGAIEVKDKFYSKDEYAMENSFRHEMMFPDDIFPATWKNIKK
mmetsp:Transcript_30698/g.61309  ORF Transcript_30698/g.61309 Transcript_30698/m.61309 type:complete len:622 (+) Transcript_30698:97-1962(+)